MKTKRFFKTVPFFLDFECAVIFSGEDNSELAFLNLIKYAFKLISKSKRKFPGRHRVI